MHIQFEAMIDYFRRLIKILFYIAFFFVLILGFLPAILDSQSFTSSFRDLLAERRFVTIAILLLAYALVYPLINFVKVKRHLNGSFSENRRHFEEAFQTLGYTLENETGSRIVYRKKSKLTRALYFWEDRVILDTTDNPVIISGMRKAVQRINRNIEQAMMKSEPL